MPRNPAKKASKSGAKKKDKPMMVMFEVVSGVAGPSLYIMDEGGKSGYRLSGPKPWGGGSVLHKFSVDLDELVASLPHRPARKARGGRG